MTSVIHGATGAQGRPLLQSLLTAGVPAVAAVRAPETYTGPGTAIAADLSSVESLTAVYRQAAGVFVHLPMGPPPVVTAYARNIAEAVVEAQPGRVVVSTSGQVVDSPGSPLQAPADSPIAVLLEGLARSGVSTAVLAPRLYLENLLQPALFDAARDEGVLRYPLRSDFPASWSSHLDVADAAVRLLVDDRSVTGTVGVGALPALTGPDLAAGFAAYFGRPVRFESVDPHDFAAALIPLYGEAAAAGVAAFYTLAATADHHQIDDSTGTQKLLDLTPRSIPTWLTEVVA
ncbi:SDR family oxidoreductase [Kribbella sp. NPDC056951]|uniref:SDR family oxidoreductase n=1 Tax=Kribbella sp. NPDC056951 TaxID=3345978 RepID=UPI00362B350B